MKMNRTISFSVALMALSLTVACGEDKKFGGSVPEATTPKAEDKKPITSAPTDDAKPDVKPSPVTPTDKPVSVPKCDPGSVGATSADLLSSGIKINTTELQTIRYELSVLSCADGSILPLKDQAIWFDLNAQSNILPYITLSYRVLSSSTGQLVGEGVLKVVEDSDLFGNTGDGYAHWETETLSYDTSTEKLILEIDTNGNSFRPTDTAAIEIPSYLKVGDTKAVERTLDILK